VSLELDRIRLMSDRKKAGNAKQWRRTEIDQKHVRVCPMSCELVENCFAGCWVSNWSGAGEYYCT
jgi:hypothetical protein